jgi:hypothetical protein
MDKSGSVLLDEQLSNIKTSKEILAARGRNKVLTPIFIGNKLKTAVISLLVLYNIDIHKLEINNGRRNK